LHVCCCAIFGWLFCRSSRTFRAFGYYLYRYWRCVREVLGTPVHNPPTDDERRDFHTLIQALAGAYKPYMADQLMSLDSAAQLPEDVVSGLVVAWHGRGVLSMSSIVYVSIVVACVPVLVHRSAVLLAQRAA